MPTFTTTPSQPAELTTLLSQIRSRIFLPAHLRTPQRALIFRTRHHALLRSDPVVLEIGSESVTLQPLDMTKDIPSSWRSIVRAMQLMSSRSDWNNLVALLEGMNTAGRRWKTWQLEKIVRDAGNSGMSAVVVECVRAAGRTGLYLRDVRVVREAMWGCRSRGAMSGWSKAETGAALRNAEHIAEALEGSLHWGNAHKRPEGADPRREADVLGVLVELVGIRAVRHQGGEDVDGKVEMYVKRLVSNLSANTLENGNTAATEVRDQGEVKANWAASADYELMRWVPVRNGLRMAKEVLKDKMPVVDQHLEKLERLIRDANDVVRSAQGDKIDKRRGLKWLEEEV